MSECRVWQCETLTVPMCAALVEMGFDENLAAEALKQVRQREH